MTQKRKTKKKTGIPKNDYDQLNFFYKLYYDFMCFFNKAYCPDYPKYWTNGIAAEQTRVNNQLNPTNGNNSIDYTFINGRRSSGSGREVKPRHATRRQKRVNNQYSIATSYKWYKPSKGNNYNGNSNGNNSNGKGSIQK